MECCSSRGKPSRAARRNSANASRDCAILQTASAMIPVKAQRCCQERQLEIWAPNCNGRARYATGAAQNAGDARSTHPGAPAPDRANRVNSSPSSRTHAPARSSIRSIWRKTSLFWPKIALSKRARLSYQWGGNTHFAHTKRARQGQPGGSTAPKEPCPHGGTTHPSSGMAPGRMYRRSSSLDHSVEQHSRHAVEWMDHHPCGRHRMRGVPDGMHVRCSSTARGRSARGRSGGGLIRCRGSSRSSRANATGRQCGPLFPPGWPFTSWDVQRSYAHRGGRGRRPR
jgi:hypothetical protein